MTEQTNGLGQEAPSLTKWKNAPTILQLKRNLQDAKPTHQQQVSQINTWLDNMHVRGSAKIKTAKNSSSIQPKLIRKQAEWRYPALSEPFLSTPDLFKVKPKTWEDRKAAQQNQILLNHQVNTAFDKVKFIDEYVRTAVDEGTVIVRVGWDFEEVEVKEMEPIIEFHLDPTVGPLHSQLAELKATSPSQWMTDVPDELKEAHELSLEHGASYRPVVLGQREVTKTKTVKNQPTVKICDYRNVVFDPTCEGDVEKAGFAVESFESSLSELRKDKRYKNLDQINIEGASPLSQPDHAPAGGATNFNFSDKARKRFVVNEYWGLWDINGDDKLVPIVSAWVGDVLIRMEENPFPDKAHPFIVEQYLPIRKSVYGEPDGELLVDNQKVVGAVTRGMIDIMGKSANGQTGMRKDMLDVTNRRKFDAGQDYEFNPNVDPRVGVHMHTYPEIPQSASFMLQLQNFEAESMTGVKSFSQGVSGASLGDVAAAVRGALDAASKRELGILRRLSNGIVKIGRKFIAMNSEFLSEEEIVRLTNEEFVTVRRDDLAGQFDLELSISTAEEDNNKAEQLAFMFQTIGPNGDQGMTKMILSDIARLRKMPDLAKRIEEYEPQPDPLMQEKLQLEVALLKAQVAAENAKAQKLLADASLAGAKVGTEGVKAANIQSDTDQKNLDFVEQESGVKQERQKELHGEQARSQGQLKLLESRITQEENQKDRDTDLLKEYVRARSKSKAA